MPDGLGSKKTCARYSRVPSYLAFCRAHAKPLAIIVACCALVAASHSEFLLLFLNQLASVYSFSFIALLFALLLPSRFFILSIPLALAAVAALDSANGFKISALSLPITFIDVKTFLADPMILVNALGIHAALNRIVYIFLGLLAFVLLACAFYRRRSYFSLRDVKLSASRDGPRTRSFPIILHVLALVVLLLAAQICLVRYGRFAYARVTTQGANLGLQLWQPSGQANLSQQLGVLEYIAFSHAAEAADISHEHGLEPAVAELSRAAAEFVNPTVRPNALLPNIVFFHAESTFDPYAAFNLSARVKLPLWSPQRETRALSPLRVNVVGGGSWVTEFEVITGVDSRIFGYHGFYTHFTIAPKVKNSFVRYLARKGYKTAAFYPVEGSFYNAEKAFRSYGFKDFVDARALRLPEDWGSLIDRDIIAAIIAHGAFKSAGPFFYFVSTSENHGPHHCRSFKSERQFVTKFAAKVSFEENCELNEYLKRAASTSAAFGLVLNQLRRIEKLTGRPFVVLVYGDHQPWSFTKGAYSVPRGSEAEWGFRDFSGVRTDADVYQTFFHLLASDRTVVRSRFTKPPPASLLPTLVSAFVATSFDDLYLPVNFLAFATCGSDARAAACKRHGDFSRAAKETLLKERPPPAPAVPMAAIDTLSGY
jgi:phosphoglycerol transferase MdoB-like AlkP superfamily enzyme